jgi:hypothetical protein
LAGKAISVRVTAGTELAARLAGSVAQRRGSVGADFAFLPQGLIPRIA